LSADDLKPIQNYIHAIEKALAGGNATEHTHRPVLKTLVEGLSAGITATNEPKHIECGAPVSGVKAPPTTLSESQAPVGNYGFRLKGEGVQARNAIDVLIQVLERLSIADPEFLTRFASRPKLGHFNTERLYHENIYWRYCPTRK